MVSDALGSFLGQRTEFAFEIIVRDDASTDGTPDIVNDWAARYPGIVRPMLLSRNTWGQRKPLSDLLPAARGRLIAVTEGDDFWVDSSKLQQQWECLTSRRAAVMCFHDSLGSQNGRIFGTRMVPRHIARDLRPSELRRSPGIPISTMLFRGQAVSRWAGDDRVHAGDRLLLAKLGYFGGGIFLPGLAGAVVFRRHPGGVNSMQSAFRQDRLAAESFGRIASFHWDSGQRILAGETVLKSGYALSGVGRLRGFAGQARQALRHRLS